MQSFKIVGAEYCYHSGGSDIFCKTVKELSNQGRVFVAKEVLAAMNEEDLLDILSSTNWPNKNFDKTLLSWGYVPSIKVEKIPEVEVLTAEGIFSKTNAFNPLNKNDHDYQLALKQEEPFYMQVKLSPQHPFMRAREAEKKKQEAQKAEKLEKKRQKQIEKARKLLEEEQQ